MEKKWSWLVRRKLRVDILTIFAVLMTIISLSIISYSYLKSSALILNLGSDLIEESAESVIDRFNDYIKPAAFSDAASAFLNNGYLNQHDIDSLINFMQILVKTNAQLSRIYIADLHGNMVIESRVYYEPDIANATQFIKMSELPIGTAFVSEVIVKKNDKAYLTAIYQDQVGRILGKRKETVIDFVPMSQAWVLGALKSPANSWVEIDKHIDAPGVQMTSSQSVLIHNRKQGAIAVDVNVDAISRFLKEFSISKNSTAFIVDHSDKVVATMMHESPRGDILPIIEEINNPTLMSAYHVFATTGKRNFTFTQNNIEYLAKFVPYALIKDNAWEIVTIVPTNDFIGQSKEEYRDILLFSFCMLSAGLFLVLIFSYRISHPIMRLAINTQQIRNLDFSPTPQIKTHIYEIQMLTDAFNAAKNALSSFSKYIPKVLLEKLLHAGTIASVGGERKYISVLFTDIRNFSSVSENMLPEKLMTNVSEYLSVVTSIIHQCSGNVDKFIGDSVMAFWGAPLEDNNHIEHACLAALLCRHELAILNEKWRALGKPIFFTRFGINTGMAIVGNMGSFDRLNYTAIGDEVNLAARLEQANKIYGTQIIVSEAVRHVCHEYFLFRPIDIFIAKGRSNTTAIYELVAAKEGKEELLATPAQIELCKLTTEAFNAYQARKMDAAVELYAKVIAKFPDDPVALYYLDRIRE